MTPNADSVRVIERCRTEMTYDGDAVRFTVMCQLDKGHIGLHRGHAEVMFAPLGVQDVR